VINHLIVVDEEDRHFVKAYPWYAQARGGYPATCSPMVDYKPGRIVLLARVIMQPKDGEVVDHIDGDTLNNRRSNLRVVTQAVNTQNRTRHQKSNTSGFRGVHWYKSKSKWQAYASIGRKRANLGYFDSAAEAGKAACEWRKANMIGYVCFCAHEAS
jgi:hypothetical protein